MEKETVPTTASLSDIYADPSNPASLEPVHKDRFTSLLSAFSSLYNSKPDFVARSPGRVNIIGEHIDYSLYNVLPMAVTVDTLVAVKLGQAQTGQQVQIKMANLNSSKFPSREFSVASSGDVEIDATKHEWTNYFKAGLRGAVSVLRKHDPSFVLPSMSIMVDGNVPTGNGLSSSAALVCSSALATMRACNHTPSKADLLDTAIVSERAVGVYSGGMDQAASVFPRQGFLLYCTFYPKFSASHVEMPNPDPDVTFLVAQSFVTSDKHVTAPRCYNLRVVECTLAAVVLARMHDVVLNPDASSLGFSLRGFQDEWCKKSGKQDESMEDQLDFMFSLTKQTLANDDGYTREEIADILGLSVRTLEETYLSKFPVEASRFHLRRRAWHVFHEARRVLDFSGTLESSKPKGLNDAKLRHLGDLMNETQESCSKIYDCSCPEIDDICEIARRAGAYGSRLTGAGWGGCTVHLVPQAKINNVTEALKAEYYAKKFPGMEKDVVKMEEAIVISKPGQGSYLIEGSVLN